MARKGCSAEQIIGKLRETEILLAKGQKVGQVSRALKLHPKHEDYLFRRSLAYARAGEARLATEDLVRINALDPAWGFAQLYYYEKKYDLALSPYGAALKHFPNSTYAPTSTTGPAAASSRKRTMRGRWSTSMAPCQVRPT